MKLRATEPRAKLVKDVRLDGVSILHRGVTFADAEDGVVRVNKDESGQKQWDRDEYGDAIVRREYTLRGRVEIVF